VVIRSRKSKDRQHNGQKKKIKRTNNDLQNTKQKTKDRATRTTLKTETKTGRVSSFCSKTSEYGFLYLLQNLSTQNKIFIYNKVLIECL